MIEVKNISFSYKKNEIIKDVTFNVNNGEIVAILGLNGSGKTTLIKLIAGLLKPLEGNIYINNENIAEIPRIELSKICGYMPQKNRGEIMTVFDSILLGRKNFFNFRPSLKDIKKVNEILEYLNLKKLSLRRTNELSGGELQKVILGRVLAQETDILLLDEPINHLDLHSQYDVMTLLKKFVRDFNKTCLIVLHDLNIALRFCEKFLFLKNGKIISYLEKNSINPHILEEVFNFKFLYREVDNIPVVIPQ